MKLNLNSDLKKVIRDAFITGALMDATNSGGAKALSEYVGDKYEPVTIDIIEEHLGYVAAVRWQAMVKAINSFKEAAHVAEGGDLS